MRVLHIFLDESMNLEHAIALCAAGADFGGFKPVAACLAGSASALRLEEAGVAVVPLPGRKTWYPGVWRRLAQARRTYNFSLVHTHDATAARLGAKCRAAWTEVRWAHTWWAPPLLKAPKELVKFKAADILAVLSRESARHLEAAGAEPSRLRVVPGGIGPSACPARVESDEARLKFAALGPLVPDSGQEILLEALALFKAANPDVVWELRLVGEGPLFDDFLRRIKVAGIAEHMAFLGPQRACDILPQCDILIAPDVRGEHGCEAVKQAWAAGLPVVCSDLPVHGEMVQNNVNGLIVPRHDAEALADRLRELKIDPALRQRLTQGGRESFKDYTFERMVETYACLYEELAADSGTGQNGQEA